MSHFKKRLQLLSIPAFRWYVVGCFLATFGGGLSYIAIVWLALSAHNSINAVANLMICFWLPGVICGPFMGVIVDRHTLPALFNLQPPTFCVPWLC